MPVADLQVVNVLSRFYSNLHVRIGFTQNSAILRVACSTVVITGHQKRRQLRATRVGQSLAMAMLPAAA
jgi:hypothetical protein